MITAPIGNATTSSLYKRYHSGIDPQMPAHYYEFYTPKHIINAALEVMGEIDLDPCSNSHIEPNVPSNYRYTKSDNGLQYTWYDKVFMNPPYGYAITEWIEKLKYHYEVGDITEAIMLVPSSTGAQWFSRMRNCTCCFVQSKLYFLRPKGFAVREAKGSSVVFYFGTNTEKFASVFSRFGGVYRCIARILPNEEATASFFVPLKLRAGVRAGPTCYPTDRGTQPPTRISPGEEGK